MLSSMPETVGRSRLSPRGHFIIGFRLLYTITVVEPNVMRRCVSHVTNRIERPALWLRVDAFEGRAAEGTVGRRVTMPIFEEQAILVGTGAVSSLEPKSFDQR